MNKLLQWAINFGQKKIVEYLLENKDEVASVMNKKINLPLMDEKSEQEFFEAMITACAEVVENIEIK